MSEEPREIPLRIRNHATGYHYTQHDHCVAWLMPDGTRTTTFWIERGNAEAVDNFIAHSEREIAHHEAELAKYKLIRAALEYEAGR